MPPHPLTNFEIQKYYHNESKKFGVEHISKGIKKFIGNKNMIVQPCDSIIRGYSCIAFIDFMLKGKSLLYYTNLFSLNDYVKYDKITLKYFQ